MNKHLYKFVICTEYYSNRSVVGTVMIQTLIMHVLTVM